MSQSRSSVSGQGKYVSPAKATMPMRSLRRALMKSATTRLAAVRRFTGWLPMYMSSISMESDTSNVSMIEMPSTFSSS